MRHKKLEALSAAEDLSTSDPLYGVVLRADTDRGDLPDSDSLAYRVPSVESDGGDLPGHEPLERAVPAAPREGDLSRVEPLSSRVPLPDLAHLVGLVVESWRTFRSWQREEVALTLRIRAWCRRLCPQPEQTKKIRKETADTAAANPSADKLYHALMGKGTHPQLDKARHPTAPFFQIRALLTEKLKDEEKLLRALAAQLPGARYCHETKGLSCFTLAALVGECPGQGRSFLDYATYQRVWKRLGLAVMPDGQRQRKVTGEAALEHGYSPVRRSIVWMIGDSAMKTGPYGERYQAIKAREKAKWEAHGYVVLPARALPTERAPHHKTAGDLHNHAKRLMEKELVRDIWREFRADARAQYPEDPYAETQPLEKDLRS